MYERLNASEIKAEFTRMQADLFIAPHKRILREEAERAGIRPEDILGERRLKKIARARQRCMLRMKEELKMSASSIGRKLGRDHSTVLHGIARARNAKEGGS